MDSDKEQLKATQNLLKICWEQNYQRDRVIQSYRDFLTNVLPTLCANIPGYSKEMGAAHFEEIAAAIEMGEPVEAIEQLLKIMN